jgi:hypothetical protein
MKQKKRQVSLGFTKEEFPEGHHIIYVYNDDEERKKTLAKFLQQGLEDHEKVIYLASDISPDEMRAELLALGVDVDKKQKDFDLLPAHYTHCPGQYFTPDFMLNMVEHYYCSAMQEGYVGARGAGEMSWALIEGRSTVHDLLEYEARLNTTLELNPLTTICQYDARRFSGELILDMLTVHPMMIVRGQLMKNPFYVEPATFLRELSQREHRKAATHQ